MSVNDKRSLVQFWNIFYSFFIFCCYLSEKLANYEELVKYLPYSTRHRSIIRTYNPKETMISNHFATLKKVLRFVFLEI